MLLSKRKSMADLKHQKLNDKNIGEAENVKLLKIRKNKPIPSNIVNPDMETERNEQEYLANKALEMGLIKEIPIPEQLIESITAEDIKNPSKLLDRVVDDYRVSRRFAIDPHNKQHLFGNKLPPPVEPLKQRIQGDTIFQMQNEVYPTQFVKQKNEPISSSRTQLPSKLCLKVYSGSDRKTYMNGTISETLQTDNIARIPVSPENKNGAKDYNQKLISMHTSLNKDYNPSNTFTNLVSENKIKGIVKRPYEWQGYTDVDKDKTDDKFVFPRDRKSAHANKFFIPGTTMRVRLEQNNLPTGKINEIQFDKEVYHKRLPSERAKILVETMKSRRALQRNGSDITFRTLNNSFDKNENQSLSSRNIQFPSGSQYYYQSNYTSANRITTLQSKQFIKGNDVKARVFGDQKTLFVTNKIN